MTKETNLLRIKEIARLSVPNGGKAIYMTPGQEAMPVSILTGTFSYYLIKMS